jgi:SAM-dependent methyltransferase
VEKDSTRDAVMETGFPACRADNPVVLVDGTVQSLAGLTPDELLALQWEQEQAFAREILATEKGSPARARVISQAYDTVTRIFEAWQADSDGPLVMGMQPRDQRLVLELLAKQRNRGLDVSFFEIGYGSGKLLEGVCDAGFPFAGIEVSPVMREQALDLLGVEHQSQLYLGDFMRCEAPMADGPWSMVYWNDVFEHVPPDEIGDWLRLIYQMLMPGGQLVTITPNWHFRPSDVTWDVCPPRTEAAGLHLKEYTLRQVRDLLVQAGFRHVASPLVVIRSRAVLCGRGLIGLKCLFEPCLEWLPFRLAKLFCRGFGFSYTIATKQPY